MDTCSIFISHSWTYSDAYDRLKDLLDAAPFFSYKDYSIPKDDPIHNTPNAAQLYEAIRGQIAPTQVVIILAGVYATYSKWIEQEISIAKHEFPLPKPILAIEPWGAEKTSQTVKDNANLIVGWNTNSVVQAIKELRR